MKLRQLHVEDNVGPKQHLHECIDGLGALSVLPN